MVSTGEKHQSFVGGKRVAGDKEITIVLSAVTESWIKDFRLLQTGLQMKLSAHAITAGVKRDTCSGVLGASGLSQPSPSVCPASKRFLTLFHIHWT